MWIAMTMHRAAVLSLERSGRVVRGPHPLAGAGPTLCLLRLASQ